ncbi:unnamed protein product [Prorocentrum cordatum]|uniref:Uncharacterized protein n=1 Tax=Prorocentrum cordatum TaxID=2364126 RepID=A0ABN9SVT0_9DINO|nr:unnamed protein product [Polarella glacialis]
MLLAALPARAAAPRQPPPVDLSRSTSPGSTQASSFSGGSAASGKSKHAGLPGGPEPGGHRRDGHAEAFVPVAPAGPRPARSTLCLTQADGDWYPSSMSKLVI